MNDAERREQGMRARRRIHGDAHVDRATASATELTAEFQDLITRYAWGEIWTRPGLDERARCMIVIASMVALRQWEELRLHMRSAMTSGTLTSAEIKEILLQQAIYCGVPAAHAAFAAFREVLDRLETGR
jgi:4-carboxymuconolactone decarboxylase